MEGGIKAWEGLKAVGAPEAGMAYFTRADRPEALIALAWLLEEGSRKFYSGLPVLVSDDDALKLFGRLAAAEEHHKSLLTGLYKSLTGGEPGAGFPGSLLGGEPKDDTMEGGVRVSEALAWVKGKELHDVLELALSLEANSYDLYIKMGRAVPGRDSQEVFRLLTAEEKDHLARLGTLLDKKL
ncbi:MAG: ferritin family protein [Nitrospirota bacterium]